MYIINVGYNSTNYFIIETTKSKLLLDAGWPGTLPKFLHVLKQKDIAIESIKYVLATHYHPDHAGLAQELKQTGAKLIVIKEQLPYLKQMHKLVKTDVAYIPITHDDNVLITTENSRMFLKQNLGINGQIILTPGHSEDSISLVLDSGETFIGDLPFISREGTHNTTVDKSKSLLLAFGAAKIYPGHGPVFKVK